MLSYADEMARSRVDRGQGNWPGLDRFVFVYPGHTALFPSQGQFSPPPAMTQNGPGSPRLLPKSHHAASNRSLGGCAVHAHWQRFAHMRASTHHNVRRSKSPRQCQTPLSAAARSLWHGGPPNKAQQTYTPLPAAPSTCYTSVFQLKRASHRPGNRGQVNKIMNN